jgi:PAS domain S-box-containing protein
MTVKETRSTNQMAYSSRTNQELIEENASLKQRIEDSDQSKSDLKQAEEKLKTKDNFLESMVQSSAVATFVVDAEHKVSYWNKACEDLTGIKSEDLLGTSDHWKAFYDNPRPCIADVIIDNNYSEINNLYAVYARSVLIPDGIRAEGWYPNLGGKNRYILFDAAPIRDDHGNIIAAIETLQDITDRKRAEEAIVVAKNDWENTFDTVTDMITIHDCDFNIVRANLAAKAILGLQPQEVSPLVKCFRSYHGTENPPTECASCQSIETKKPSTVEVFEPHLNKHLEISAIPRFGSDGRLIGLIHVVRDISERKLAEKSLQQAHDELAMRNKNLEEMNTALHVLLQKREDDKRQVEELIVSNIRSLVYPYVEKMRNDLPNAERQFLIDILETHLNELLSPLLKYLQQFNLTPKEVQVATMVKDGKTTKEIAKVLGVATSSIDAHRNSIRRKLDLSRKANLQSKLQSLM